MRITFWGAAGTVTGSRFVVDTGGNRVLVDCCLFQGIKPIRQRNWEPSRSTRPPSTRWW